MIAIDFIKDRRKYKRVYHDVEMWYIHRGYLLVDDKIIGSVDWNMSRYLEKEFFALLIDVVDPSWDATKYHVFVSKNAKKITDVELDEAIHTAIVAANRETQ